MKLHWSNKRCFISSVTLIQGMEKVGLLAVKMVLNLLSTPMVDFLSVGAGIPVFVGVGVGFGLGIAMSLVVCGPFCVYGCVCVFV